MLPVMAVQAWGIYIRFDAYGLTTARYASMICNAFGLLTILSALLGKSGKHLFLAAGIIVLLCSLTPLNIIDVPAKDQGHRLEKILEKYDMVKDGKVTIPSDMTEQDKKDLKSAYHYLSYDPGRWRYPAVEMINKDKELMPFFFSYREEDDHLDLYHAWSMIPAAGYERMYIFDITTNKAADGDIFTFPTENGNQEIPLAPYIENLRNLSPNSSDNVKDRLIYRLDENRIIYFVHVRIPKERDGNYYRLQGYIFEK